MLCKCPGAPSRQTAGKSPFVQLQWRGMFTDSWLPAAAVLENLKHRGRVTGTLGKRPWWKLHLVGGIGSWLLLMLASVSSLVLLSSRRSSLLTRHGRGREVAAQMLSDLIRARSCLLTAWLGPMIPVTNQVGTTAALMVS